MNNKTFLFASGNKGKLAEVRSVAKNFGVTVVAPADLEKDTQPPNVDESASSYAGNAKLKAEAFASWADMPAFSDDTGLEVDALGGAPGVYSARYAGESCKMEDNINKLLETLKGEQNRAAKFCCTICVYREGKTELFNAELKGQIAKERSGKGGFGYDSVFIVDGYNKSLAQIKEEGLPLKTHRVLALEKFFKSL